MSEKADEQPVYVNRCCCISPEEIAEREREAGVRGAKASLVRVLQWANRCAQIHGRGPLAADFVRAFEIVIAELERGEWPKEER